MQLYFSPLACSLATRISLYDAGAEAAYIEVDPKTKLTSDGKNFRDIHPLGLVPTLRTDDGDVLTENAAILQHVAEVLPQANLAPTDSRGRTRLQQWLCFIGTELHKALFVPLLDAKAPEAAKAYALEKAASRLGYLEKHLTGREFLLDRFSVADAYLFTVLNWSVVTPVDLKPWPAISAYVARLRERPSVARAFAEEAKLYAAEQKRHKASA
ncbi:glutathione S-transferase family protein [Pyxidicoccus parkwayensis]|uniref:Glutathione S-transferase family protein n=1 Tax=Pyxidicoccus parkwayensis TaxID=2813578 RepID=A0ABX7PAY1_9BACT|nr:glutathione binding-like protein [Pyxidicoccus parkwaysis]QSQ27568.1 glutathione S-transferase family protein [Pyxidicoccus parkwaysis]